MARRQFIGWRGKAETSMVATALDPVRACSWPTSSTRDSRRGGMLSAVTTALQRQPQQSTQLVHAQRACVGQAQPERQGVGGT